MNDKLTPVEEQVLDALLVETLGKAGPPDLSRQILAKLHDAPSEVGAIVCQDDRGTKRDTRATSARKQIAVLITAIAALAASLFFFATWLRPDRRLDDSPPWVAANAPRPDEITSLSTPSPGTSSDAPRTSLADAAPVTPPPPRGIPMMIDSTPGNESESIVQDRTGTNPSALQAPLAAVSLVSSQADAELRSYWNAIGIQPAGDAPTDEVTARLSTVLGIKLSPESIDDPTRFQAEFARKQVARSIARRWLLQITDNGLARIDHEAGDPLVEELATCFASEQEFDQVLAAWIGGRSPKSLAFYDAISAGPSYANGTDAMARRLASLTMNVDLRCTKCHDSYIERNGLQQDYWAFSAFLRSGVTRDPAGQVTIDAPPKIGKPFFYELPDGRQRIAEPVVAATWIKSESGQPIRGVAQWADRLVGSPELARGVVNSLWQLVHGQPLRGRVVDPISAPHNEALDRLEEHLVQDLLLSRFDVARTLALIIASPATRRTVPAPLLPENALVADESETRAAMNAVDAFAAALPPRVQLPMSDRLDEAKRAIGVKLDADGRPFVAQIAGTTDNSRSTTPDSKAPAPKPLSADFPHAAKSFPVQWLTSIESETSQVEHLAYLAGMSQVPGSVLEVVQEMRSADVSNEQVLQRAWWLLRP